MTISIVDPGVTPEPSESHDSVGVPPYSIALDDGDTPHDVIDALALAPFTAGTQPWACSAVITRAWTDAPLMPADATVARASKSLGSTAHLVVGDGWTLRAARWSNQRVRALR